MPAAVLRGRGRLEVEDVPVPELRAGEVLVEVSHCGVCGSDLHMVIEGWGRKGSIGGHEWSGVIVATGADVTGWSVGEGIVGGAPARRGGGGPFWSGRPPP